MEDKKLAPEGTLEAAPSFNRRDFVSAALGASLMAMVPPGVRSGAWAAGSDAPEKKEVRIGFIPLTDCASVVMAAVNKFDEKYGIKIIATKEASWASVRDKLVNGELDCAHVLYGLVYGVQLGIGGPKKDMNVLMSLSNNGQAITLSNQLKDKGATDGASLAALVAKKEREYTFAQTFPTGTHAMWLYYWLTDRKWAYIRMEGTTFGDVPLNVELKLEVWDSPNSAGVVIDAIRCAKMALDRKMSGALFGPSSYFMKSPPEQYTDDVAHAKTEAFIRGE